MRLPTLCLTALLALAACRAPSPTPTAPRRMQLVLLAGQSNMAGRGYVEPEDKVPNAHVLMLDSAGRWVPAVDPVHFDKPTAGVGPGRAFGLALAARDTAAVIGLVPTAVGGTSITSWVPGGYDAATRTHPYDDALRRIAVARTAGSFVAILWHQGESDSNARGVAEHEGRLRELIGRLRAATGAPDAPFLIGELGRFPEKPWAPERAAIDSIHRLVARTTPDARYVSSEGLGHRGDTLHFSAPAARELGRRYAAAYFTLRGVSAR
jgi:Carbohydrate esterase, sialic acid-specific acetylesterase